jgi:hypothetical protein
VASGCSRALCSLRIATICPAGTPRSVRAARRVVTLTGVSVSLYEVSGASKRGTIDESETNNTPNTTTVQRKYFTGKTPSCEGATRLGIVCQGETDRRCPRLASCRAIVRRIRTLEAHTPPAINRTPSAFPSARLDPCKPSLLAQYRSSLPGAT